MEPTFPPLKLLAKDFEDLRILVAHLQDALMPLMAMSHDRSTELFSIVANRHRWEHKPIEHEGKPLYHRVRSAIHFRDVKNIHHRGFHPKGPLRTLNFLTAEPKGGNLHLIFSGDNEIRLQVKGIHCYLEDFGDPWPTRKHPVHIHEHIEAYHREFS